MWFEFTSPSAGSVTLVTDHFVLSTPGGISRNVRSFAACLFGTHVAMLHQITWSVSSTSFFAAPAVAAGVWTLNRVKLWVSSIVFAFADFFDGCTGSRWQHASLHNRTTAEQALANHRHNHRHNGNRLFLCCTFNLCVDASLAASPLSHHRFVAVATVNQHSCCCRCSSFGVLFALQHSMSLVV